MATEASGGGTPDLGFFLEVFGYIRGVGVGNKSGGGSSGCPRGREARLTLWARPLPRGYHVGPPDLFSTPNPPINTQTSRKKPRSGVPPLQASVATKNLLGARSGTLPEGEPITGGHLHHGESGALHDEEGVVHPRG